MASHGLVPGDVVVLQPGKATCDMVLLQGNCLVDEAVLSGEVPSCVLGQCEQIYMTCTVMAGLATL